jgi:uncharacterized glyoxalase superfamily protein PhnB
MKVPSLIPVLMVDDIRDAIAFYLLLGFSEDKQYTFADENGSLVHAHLHKDGSVLFLGLPDRSYNKVSERAKRVETSTVVERGLGLTMIIQTQNLDEIYGMVKKRGLPILYEPANEWYGDKVFLFIDPFGYEWKVSQAL